MGLAFVSDDIYSDWPVRVEKCIYIRKMWSYVNHMCRCDAYAFQKLFIYIRRSEIMLYILAILEV